MKENELSDRPHKGKGPPTMARNGSFGQKEVPYSIGRDCLGREKGLSSGADGFSARGKGLSTRDYAACAVLKLVYICPRVRKGKATDEDSLAQ